VVGIGASAGGLEALEKFLAHVPLGSEMAFVVVQHLDPTVEDLLPELLQRITPMTVLQARDQMRVSPNCVYVIPPNKDIAVRAGLLHLSAPTAARGMRLPIDFCFRSLAQDQRQRSIGVILSGMGADGCLGLRAIKEAGGLGLAQDPAGARFDSMPRAVISAGLADQVAPAEDLPARIISHLQNTLGFAPLSAAREEPEDLALEQITLQLRTHTGQEFSLYKRNTVLRRIERRMDVHQIATIQGYAHFLEANPNEVDLLFKELLIGVTSFFRDPAVWKVVGEEVLPAMIQERTGERIFRAWVPGCSTGEEAYSLAILFREALDRIPHPRNCALQVFATDLDRDAIVRARQGFFKPGIAEEVSAQRLERFFNAEDGGYRVRKEIREMVVFAPQNLIMDPPFTRLDLLSCRNLLIYLTPVLQKKLMLLFHYSLVPGGVLCLGNSESIGSFTDLFVPWSPKSRLFKHSGARLPLQAVTFPPAFAVARKGAPPEPKMADTVPNLSALADQVLLQQFAPPAVLVNDSGDIIYISGRTGKYLEPAAGKANWNIFAMAREGLRMELGSALHRAARQPEPVVTTGLRVENGGGLVGLTVQKLAAPGPLQGLIMVVFRDQPAPAAGGPPPPESGAGGPRVKQLQQELLQSREALYSLQQEMQTSQEELKSTNEELQSTNEELQSTNEELTTSKEELQSLNEELQTINAEQQSRMEELARTSSDMKNLLDSTNIATVFLDPELRVGRFTSGVSRLYQLLPGDVGRPLTDVTTALCYDTLPDDAREVLRTLIPVEKAVTTRDGRWFTVRIMPYRTQDNRIDGLVLTYTETTTAKQLERDLRATASEFQALLANLGAGYVLCAPLMDPAGKPADGQVVQSNRAFTRMLPGRTAPAGRTLLELLPALEPVLQPALARTPLTGAPHVFERYCTVGSASFELTTYYPVPDHFVCLFRDASEAGRPLQASRGGDTHHEDALP